MNIISQFDVGEQFILRIRAAKKNLNPDSLTAEQALCILDEYERAHPMPVSNMDGLVIP